MNKTVPLYGFGGGGGTSLNFKVVRYDTEEQLRAAKPKPNTIGVVTTTDISGWTFQREAPSAPVHGMMWFETAKTSSVEFNALKKNGLTVYPTAAKQYIADAFVSLPAFTYNGEQWVSWVTYLYNLGDEFKDLTGGLVGNAQKNNSSYTGKAPSISRGATSFTATLSASGLTSGSVSFANQIDLTDVNTIHYKVTAINKTGDGTQSAWVGASRTGAFNSASNNKIAKALQVSDDFTIDVSNITGLNYVGIKMAGEATGDKSHCPIESIWMT